MTIEMKPVVAIVISVIIVGCDSGAVQLDPSNIDSILQNNDLVLINFYADWCRYFLSTI